jgi:lysophospholipase L1-like esterase
VSRKAVVVLAGLLVVVLAGCWHDPNPNYAGPSWNPRVAVLGDSITFHAGDALAARFRRHHPTSISGLIGWRSDELVEVANNYARTNPAIVVVNIGTNDYAYPPHWTDHHIALIRERYRQSCFVAVTLNEQTPSPTTNMRHRRVNERLRHRFPNVFDWNAHIASNPRWHVSDGLHPTLHGSSWYADRLAEFVYTHCPLQRPR